MLVANIESEVKRIVEKKGRGGWLRTTECAREYGKDPITKKRNKSRETRFYRWRRKVEKGKVSGFQVLKLPNNISFIGLESADLSLIAPQRFAIVKVVVDKADVEIPRGRSLTFELTLRNKLRTPTTVEEVISRVDKEPSRTHKFIKDIPAGGTRRIEFASSDIQIGKIWKEGGQINLQVVHTYGAESLSLEVPPLHDRSLPQVLLRSD